MTEETKKELAATEPTISTKDIRESELFRTATGKQKEKIDSVEAELAALKTSIADKAKADRDEALKSQGNWDTLENELRAEIIARDALHAKRELDWKVRAELGRNFSDQFFIDAMASKYDGDKEGIVAHVEELAKSEEYARYRSNYVPPPSVAQPPAGSVPAARSTGTMTKGRLDALANSADASERMEAINYKKAIYDRDGHFGNLPK